MIKNKEEIIAWLTEHNIQKFEIIDDLFYAYLVNVNETVSLPNKSLKEIPIKFNFINGHFNVSHNLLTNLDFSPIEVNGTFNISNNQITTLKDGPRKINGAYNCSLDNLPALKRRGFPLWAFFVQNG